jgi:hypothetical protein
MGFSLAVHAALLLAAAHAIPALNETDTLQTWDATPYIITPRVETVTDREPDAPTFERVETSDPDDRPIVNSRCADEHGGSMGDPVVGKARRRYGVQGPADNADPHLARWAAWRDAWESYIGLTPRPWGGDPTAPVVAWGRDDSLGNDAKSARGNLWGDDIGMAIGSPGAGIGHREICATCGGSGRGMRSYPTEEGGPTLTQSTSDLAFR